MYNRRSRALNDPEVQSKIHNALLPGEVCIIGTKAAETPKSFEQVSLERIQEFLGVVKELEVTKALGKGGAGLFLGPISSKFYSGRRSLKERFEELELSDFGVSTLDSRGT